MPESRFTEFPALSVGSRVVISRSAIPAYQFVIGLRFLGLHQSLIVFLAYYWKNHSFYNDKFIISLNFFTRINIV